MGVKGLGGETSRGEKSRGEKAGVNRHVAPLDILRSNGSFKIMYLFELRWYLFRKLSSFKIIFFDN